MQIINRFRRLPFVFGALWSVGASIRILLTPMNFQSVIATIAEDGSESVEEVVKQVSWYEMQGLWGVIILIIFAFLFSTIGVLAFRGRLIILAVFSLLAISLTILASLSIGLLYFPAVLLVVIGWILLGLEKLLRPSDQISS